MRRMGRCLLLAAADRAVVSQRNFAFTNPSEPPLLGIDRPVQRHSVPQEQQPNPLAANRAVRLDRNFAYQRAGTVQT
jgi:hypothetical protein